MDDDYEARMRERAARRAAAKAAAGETPAPAESTPAAAPPADDYEARVRERALKRENSRKQVNEEVSRESSPKKEEEEEAPKQEEKQEEEAPKQQEEEQQKEEQPKKVEEPEEEEQPKKEPTPPPKEETQQEEEDSYKKPRSSTRSQVRSSVATSTPASSTSRSTPTPAATTTTSAPSSRFGSSTTPASNTPVSRSAGRDRPVSVASPPTEKKDFRSNRFSVAPETTSTPPPQNGEEAPKRKAISLASKSQEAEDMVKRIVEGDEEVAWVLFNCDQNVQIHSQGVGEVEALKAKLDDTMVLYGYIRVPVGAEGRTKFVYIRWVGTKIKPIQRAKALDNEKVIKSFTRVYHIEVHTSERDDLTSSKVNDKLARAGGANYDKTQNTGGKVDSNASFSSYKERSRDFFYEKEREGNVKQVVFEKGPIGRTTPVNLAGRAMTVGAATANKNLVDLKTKKNQE